MTMNQMKIKQEVSLSVAKMAMDSAEVYVEELVQMLDQSTEILQALDPNLGNIIDIEA